MGQRFLAEDLGIVIPTRDRPRILGRTLASLVRQHDQGFAALVVVDGDDGQAAPVATAPWCSTMVVRHRGPGMARNAGVSALARPLVLFLGDDMQAAPDLVRRHLDVHNRHRRDEDVVLGRVQWHPSVAWRPANRWLESSRSQFDFPETGGKSVGRSLRGPSSTIPDVGFGRFYSCNVSLKRSFFERVGGFDPAFPYYYEDLDFGYRAEQLGMRLFFEPEAVTFHRHPYRWMDVEHRFHGVGAGEHAMAALHEWFRPFFLDRIAGALDLPPASPFWNALSAMVPAPRLLPRPWRDRADLYHWRKFAPAFHSGWWQAEELQELRSYLGDDFDQDMLESHERAVAEERAASGDEGTFYRSSRSYLYDLTAFAMSATKAPYHAELVSLVPPGSHLLDYGCGIGSDGLLLGRAGYRVAFADFANPSTHYLAWRLARRGWDSPVYDLDRDEIPDHFDLAFSFDVIEHVEEPRAYLELLEGLASVVVVNLLEETEDDEEHGTLHHNLPIRALLDHAEDCGLLRYRLYHGRSHLIAYRSPSHRGNMAGPSRVRSLARRRAGRLLPSREAWFPLPPHRPQRAEVRSAL